MTAALRHFLEVDDLAADELEAVLDLAALVKRDRRVLSGSGS